MKFVQLCKIKTEDSLFCFLFFTVKTCKGVVSVEVKGHRKKSIKR